MIQQAREEIAADMDFGTLCDLASEEGILSIVDCNDQRFLAPSSMVEEVKKACKEINQKVPETRGEVAAVIYRSLADCYRKTAEEIEDSMGTAYESIHVVGGGAQASFLNRLTAEATGKRVLAGPIEATAIGNLAVQMINAGIYKDLQRARQCIRTSFNIEVYEKQEAIQ